MSHFAVWGVTASPYLLKMQALLDYSEQSWRVHPGQGGRLANLRLFARLNRAKSSGAIRRYPAVPDKLDEYPAVPFYTGDGKTFYFDSSALAYHLDAQPDAHTRPLVPSDPAQGFVCQLIDEAFDEFGLYMAHHMRWIGSARSTAMGAVTGQEMSRVLPLGLHRRIERQLPKRQVRRCPYLFSVAPHNYDTGVEPALTPPSRAGFPPTHDLLNESWEATIRAMDSVLAQQPYLLGQRFTLADASAHGQLSMNFIDGQACQRLQRLAPRTYTWLCRIRDGKHVGSEGPLSISTALDPVLAVIAETFVPLMQQNHAAYRAALDDGQIEFNEAAFDKGQALYDGELRGHPFRAVIKTFQVRVWRDLLQAWTALTTPQQNEIAQRLPENCIQTFNGHAPGAPSRTETP